MSESDVYRRSYAPADFCCLWLFTQDSASDDDHRLRSKIYDWITVLPCGSLLSLPITALIPSDSLSVIVLKLPSTNVPGSRTLIRMFSSPTSTGMSLPPANGDNVVGLRFWFRRRRPRFHHVERDNVFIAIGHRIHIFNT